MSKTYYQGETMPQSVRVTDSAGVLIDPDTIIISIVDPDGTTKVDGVNMTKDGTGEYNFKYLLADDALIGKWKTEIKADKGFIQIEQDEFTVLEAIG